MGLDDGVIASGPTIQGVDKEIPSNIGSVNEGCMSVQVLVPGGCGIGRRAIFTDGSVLIWYDGNRPAVIIFGQGLHHNGWFCYGFYRMIASLDTQLTRIGLLAASWMARSRSVKRVVYAF